MPEIAVRDQLDVRLEFANAQDLVIAVAWLELIGVNFSRGSPWADSVWFSSRHLELVKQGLAGIRYSGFSDIGG